ncbi:MAG: HU family DNA-binding protein [Myxococcales bacterium]|nr:HU family DNA-binding protein [Myxococcales bacterium]
MNKKELSAALAWRAGMSRVRANEIVGLLFDADDGIFANELVEGGKVTLPGFGTLLTKLRAERIGTNPSSGERITIPSRTTAYFKTGKTLRGRLDD